MFGLGLGRLLGVGRFVGVGLRLDRQGLGVLGVGRRRHPVESRKEVEVVETDALARLRGAAPLAGGHPDPDVAALDVLADDRVAEDGLQLVEDLPARLVRGRVLVLLFFFDCVS